MGEIWTRRGILTLAAGAGATRLFAFSSDSWEKKDSADWTHEDIEKLTTKSPWAKEVSASAPSNGGGMGQRGGGWAAAEWAAVAWGATAEEWDGRAAGNLIKEPSYGKAPSRL